MKKFVLLMICLLLCSCGGRQEVAVEVSKSVTVSETTEALSESSAETSSARTEPVVTETEATMETEPDDECHCEYDWQHSYAEYINQLWFYYGFYIDDINGDDIPEAVISVNPLEYTIILYYTENGLAELELATMSDWGSVGYIADTKQILFSPMRGHTTGTWGYTEEYIYDWTGTEYTETLSVLRESGYLHELDGEYYEEFGQAYINGEEVDNDTFEAKMEEIRELAKGNGYFPVVYITDENFETYAKEKLPDFKMPEFNY